MRTNTLFAIPGHLMTWGRFLPSADRYDRRGAAACWTSFSATHPIIDNRRSVRERIPDS